MPFTQPLSSITYSLEPASAVDLPELVEIMIAAMSYDPFWTGMTGGLPYEEEYKVTYQTLVPRFVNAWQLDAYESWKVVDEHGRILAWAGLGKPVLLTEEQKKSITTTYELPLGRNEKLYEFFQGTILPSAVKHGYDPSRHFQRQNMMVRPEYQRQGLGRLLTEKCNEIADERGGATYVRARPGAAGLFVQMGFETLERIDFDLSDYGLEGGKTAVFLMRRDAGAPNQSRKKLIWNDNV